jgi:putative endonuclease
MSGVRSVSKSLGSKQSLISHKRFDLGQTFFFESTFHMFYTYILYSNKADKFYIGATENLEQRLAKHRNKNKGFTNQADDWQIVYSKEFQTKSEALAYERQIKSWKSKKKIISLIESK